MIFIAWKQMHIQDKFYGSVGGPLAQPEILCRGFCPIFFIQKEWQMVLAINNKLYNRSIH